MKRIITIILVVLLITSAVHALPNWDIYSDAVIQDGDEYNVVSVYDTPSGHTTVDMFGGWVDTLRTYDESTLNLRGGEINTFNAYDLSKVNVSAGYIFSLEARDTSYVTVLQNAMINSLGAIDSATVYVYGGIIEHCGAGESGTMNLYGGVFSDALGASASGQLNIYGYNLLKACTGGHYGFGFVSGEWVDRTTFNINLSGPDTYSHINLITLIDAEIDIIPNTLNLSSKGKWISCHIKLPEVHNVADVNSYTVLLQNEVPAKWIWFNERQNVVMAKFERSELQEALEPGDIKLTVTGYLNDGSYFIGTDTIKVLQKAV